jgi:LysR family glycine cleavage system transcriptional activator
LTVFNEVAKTKNLTRAAENLGISQSAISHQIRDLEQRVGRQLLLRHAQGVSLTQHGQSLSSTTEPAFRLLDAGFSEVSRKQRKRSLTISLPTALALKWLVPRLKDFRKLHPDLDLFLDTTDTLVDFDTSDVDVAIRYAIPTEGNYYMSKIRDESLVAVLSPSLLAEAKKANPSPDINNFPILEDAFDSRWNEWAELSKQTFDRATNSIVKYTDSAVMISAATNSQGMALARLIMVEDDIAQGRLIMFNHKQVTLERQLLFLCRRSERNEAGVAAFRRWLKVLE